MIAATVAALLLAPLYARATVIDLTTTGASSGLVTSANGVTYQVDQVGPQPTGTGVIDPFLRIQASGNEQGYNTSLSTPFDDKASGYTRALNLSEIPIVNIGGVNYRQFLLDINEDSGGNHELLSLNQIQIFQSATDRDDGVLSSTASNTNTAVLGFSSPTLTPIFQLNNSPATGSTEIRLNYALNSGSGSGDMFLYVADAAFDPNTSFVILYSQFGDPNGFASSSDGFEEWATLKPEGTPPVSPIPEPGTMALALTGALGFGLAGFRRFRRRPTA